MLDDSIKSLVEYESHDEKDDEESYSLSESSRKDQNDVFQKQSTLSRKSSRLSTITSVNASYSICSDQDFSQDFEESETNNTSSGEEMPLNYQYRKKKKAKYAVVRKKNPSRKKKSEVEEEREIEDIEESEVEEEITIKPKRRGRPRKYKRKAPISRAKGNTGARGRTSKSKLEDPKFNETVPVRRPIGRPRKYKVAKAFIDDFVEDVPLKTAKARSRKSKSEQQETHEEAPVPKRIGRPRKYGNTKKESQTAAKAIGRLRKHTIGRPRK